MIPMRAKYRVTFCDVVEYFARGNTDTAYVGFGFDGDVVGGFHG